MPRWTATAGLAALLTTAQPAAATTDADMVDLRHVETVLEAVQAAGYKAEIKANPKGERYISVASKEDVEFTISFYGCDAPEGCSSFSISAWWKKEGFFSNDLVNEWNDGHRFLKASIDADGDIEEYMDLSSIGGVSREFFEDELGWFLDMDADFSDFLDKKRPKS
ncbi:YbjN domain-containing protein [Sphingomonas sp.]|uniref:YbjN domain-containing protein n=1 Tax=Sphingomonas sp. TaxID=28214 RepID=UPI001B2E2787|nr:YbjN domain-containing protein [Sphingomonas sp.]MBO9713819.1 YbjN domain-containing protein [Sphingomonas sp.]